MNPLPASEALRPSRPSRLTLVAGGLYRVLLRFYPRPFQATFGDEMVEVFEEAVNEATGEGGWQLVNVMLRELAEWPLALVLEYRYQRRKKMMRWLQVNWTTEVRTVRWVARLLSVLVAVFLLSLLAFNEDVRTEPTPPFLVICLLSLFLLAGWRWERVGGLLAMLGSPVLVLSILIYWWGQTNMVVPLWGMALLGSGMALAFFIVGWLYVSISQVGSPTDAVAAAEQVSDRPRRWVTWVIIAVLALVVLVLLVVPNLAAFLATFQP